MNRVVVLTNHLSGTVTKTIVEKEPKFLTPTQLRVLQLSAEGYSCKDSAAIMGIVTETVKHHRTALMRRLDAENIAHAVYIGLKTAIIV